MRDFTLKKYRLLVKTLIEKEFSFLNISNAITDRDLYKKNNLATIRHDIDTKFDLSIATEMAELSGK